jgi:hypothetical protein
MISEKSDVSAFSRVPKDPLKSNLYIPANKRMKKPLKKQRPDIPIDFERERTAHFVDSARTREDKRETEVTEKIEFGCADRNSADSRFNYLKNEM